MTLKLSDFHLNSYDERSALQYALAVMKERGVPDWYAVAVQALELRLSRTECQPGGCSHCRPDLHTQDWED